MPRAGYPDATYYVWKSKYGGMEAPDVRRLKDLEEENSRLKPMFADLSLENMALKDVIEKKNVDPAHTRPLMLWLMDTHGAGLVRQWDFLDRPRVTGVGRTAMGW